MARRSWPGWLPPFLLGNALMLSLMAAALWLGKERLRPRARPADVHAMSRIGSNRDVGLKPWGELAALEFPLADAKELTAEYDRFMGPPKWFFNAASQQQIARYFLASNIRYRDRHKLFNRQYWNVTTNGCEISPPDSVVYGLDNITRSRIYAVLAKSETNFAQRAALLLPRANLEQQLLSIGLNRTQVARLQQLTYTNAGMLCIADLGVAEKVLGPEAFQRLVEFLFAIPAYRLNLLVTEKSDIDALAAYWGRGGREELIKPLLKSLARVPGGADINISYLLPDFARLRLYRYPDDHQPNPPAFSEDCHYSAMNFFCSSPDTNFLDMAYVKRVLSQDYEPISDSPILGDVILVQDDKGNPIHTSVYIAADFVFTKNGISPTKPWTLMRLEDMLAVYCGQQTSVQMQIVRLKNLPPPKARPDSA